MKERLENQIMYADIPSLDTNVINKAVVAFCDSANIDSGSSGDVDLYQLMHTYLTKPESRKEINAIVSKHLRTSHNLNYPEIRFNSQ